MTFFQPAGMSVRIGRVGEQRQDKSADLRTMVLSEESVLRGGSVDECFGQKERGAWILGPNVPKKLFKKIEMFENYAECMNY